ncbi:hypothetical protein FACS1894161_1600 [Spirochaetia bacterium]|nr:hypothetical protein FACS1894161_1600 [Spirochaetia bacterium]
MVTLEQIKLLESKIIKAIDVVNRLTEENIRLKKRNGELEELAERLKDEKARVEAGIVSALDRLNQFEDAIERSLAAVKPAVAPAATSVPHAAAPGLVIHPAPIYTPPAAAIPPPEAPPAEAVAPFTDAVPAGGLPSAYTVNEVEPEELESAETGEAELDIF